MYTTRVYTDYASTTKNLLITFVTLRVEQLRWPDFQNLINLFHPLAAFFVAWLHYAISKSIKFYMESSHSYA